MFKLFFDSTSILALVERIFAGVAGLITTYLIFLKFTLEIQGLYYTFIAILTIKVLLERCSGAGLVSLVTHQWAKISNQQAINTVRDSGLTQIAIYAVKWYFSAALITFIVMVLGGSFFFLSSKADISPVLWAPPWIGIALYSGINIALIPFWIFLEGCGRVKTVYQFRLAQLIVFNITMWVFIYLDLGLWALPMSGAIDLVIVFFFIFYQYQNFFKTIFIIKNENKKINEFETSISQFHWRISVGWVLSFIFINSFVPAIFFWHGSVAAGRMGMSWSMIGALLGLTTNLTMSKATLFNLFVAQKDWINLSNLLMKVLLTSLGIMAIGSVFFIMGYNLIIVYKPEALTRVIGIGNFLLFLIGASVAALILPVVVYLRAFRMDPLFYLNLFTSVFGVLGVIYLAKDYAISGVAILFISVTFFQAVITLSYLKIKTRTLKSKF